jgi:hypothetical protein
MLSRLPANSFVQTWREIRPDQLPLDNVYDVSQQHNIRFVLRGAPNEFALNTNIYVCGAANLNVAVSDTAITVGSALDQDGLAKFFGTSESQLKAPVNFFQSSRESFNAGALPYLDNQDPQRSGVITHMRYRLARRNATAAAIQDLKSAFTLSRGEVLEAGKGLAEWSGNGNTSAEGLRLAVKTGTSNYDLYSGDSKHFQIPLGTYSNFVNSHSILPLGLLSSYAVNGWQIELKTSVQDGNSGKVYQTGLYDGASGTLQIDSAKCYLKDIRIFVPIVRVLDPAVMEAVLSLYEKREQVSVGGVSFPLSLRLNTMAYRFANYPLNNQKDYFFRIAGTDRSVRAVAWWIYNTSRANNGEYNLFRKPIRVTRLETNIGSEHIHDVVEDTDVNSSNVNNFISMNAKRSAAMFSPLPYYQEGSKFDGQQDDDLNKFNNATFSALYGSGDILYERNSLAYGVVSMENLDRREGDYSGSFQASGKDLTNVGAIEMRMRIEAYPADSIGKAGVAEASVQEELQSPYAASTAPGESYQIVFAYAYDSVMEVSPQGVMDVTNAVL